MSLITNNEELTAFCQRQKKADFLTIDTEFMRERTFWPKLCLVQVGGADEAAAIDPLAEGINLSPLFDLMNDPKILKVFHAARQDVEIFFNLTGKIPSPMFDTQVAAMVCGFGEAVSYENLVSALADAKIDKTSRYTDWANRPLSEKQLAYALGDVTHLRTIYKRLKATLDKNGRSEWLEDEMKTLTSTATYDLAPEDAWKRLKLRGNKPRYRALAKELAAWRESEARRINVPRGRIMKDETLLEIIYHPPESSKDLAKIRGLNANTAEGKQGALILQAVERAMALPLDQCPKLEDSKPLTGNPGAAADMLRVLLKHVCEENGVAQRLIANSEDLETIALSNDKENIPALKGWRHEIFGKLALELKQGKLLIGLNGKKIALHKKS